MKADIRHYFESVDHATLLDIIAKRVKDDSIIWLIKTILANYDSGIPGKGMPLGNWTSQFFANVYLNELDQFAKHPLKAKYYLRYVDDFVILHRSKKSLQEYERQISQFLSKLNLQLHPDKCVIIPVKSGIPFLGFRTFYHYRLVRKRNYRQIMNRLRIFLQAYEDGADYMHVFNVLDGWFTYAMHANTHNLHQRMENWVKKELEDRKKMHENAC